MTPDLLNFMIMTTEEPVDSHDSLELYFSFPEIIYPKNISSEKLGNLIEKFNNRIKKISEKISNLEQLSDDELAILESISDITIAIAFTLLAPIIDQFNQLEIFCKNKIHLELKKQSSSDDNDNKSLCLHFNYNDGSNIITFDIQKDLNISIKTLLNGNIEKLLASALSHFLQHRSKIKIEEREDFGEYEKIETDEIAGTKAMRTRINRKVSQLKAIGRALKML